MTFYFCINENMKYICTSGDPIRLEFQIPQIVCLYKLI